MIHAADRAARDCTLVSTPRVRSPEGSTDRAILSPSLFARSYNKHMHIIYMYVYQYIVYHSIKVRQGVLLTWLAAVTAKMIALGLDMKSQHMERISSSMSVGWSPGRICI